MKDYAVQIKIKNNWLLAKMRAAGFETAADLARASGISQSYIGELLNMKAAPINKDEMWSGRVVKIADVLKCVPDDLFPPQHRRAMLEKNNAELLLSADEIKGLVYSQSKVLPPDLIVERKELLGSITKALESLSPRLERVVRQRYGIDCDALTLDETAVKMGITRARVRQIEMRALRKLKWRMEKNGIENVAGNLDEGTT